MRIAGVKPSSLVNGPGLRYTIFMQGCQHYCPGCQNKDTWAINGGKEVEIKDILRDIRKRAQLLDGITISGGEPFLQQDELCQLIMRLPEKLTVWIYTGYLYEEIKHTRLAQLAHYIVDGKFEKSKLVTDWYGGSSNQRLINMRKGSIKMYGE